MRQNTRRPHFSSGVGCTKSLVNQIRDSNKWGYKISFYNSTLPSSLGHLIKQIPEIFFPLSLHILNRPAVYHFNVAPWMSEIWFKGEPFVKEKYASI